MKKTKALARTTRRTIATPKREMAIVPFEKSTDGSIALPDEQKFQGASSLDLPKKIEAALRAPFTDAEYDVLPSGECYVSHVYVRRRLNEILGMGQWSFVPAGPPTAQDERIIVREYYFYVRQHFVRAVFGEAAYEKSNRRMSWGDALEAAYSNAITRGAKDLNVASECWDRRWTSAWLKKWAIRVWVEDKREGGKLKVAWRRRDADPLPYERGLVKTREGEEGDGPERRPVKSTGEATELISPKQEGDLIDLARKHGVAPSALEKIVGGETGQTQFARIQASQYQRILAIVEKIVPLKSGGK